MAMYADCIPCQYGHHDEHQPVPGPVPEGVIGGWVCPCAGDCAERNPPIKSIPMEVDPEQERQWKEVFDFLDSVATPRRRHGD